MQTLTIASSKNKQVIDITDEVNELVAAGKIADGLCHLFVAHTTAALTTADLDPGTDLDMLDAFAEMVPRLQYRHPHNPAHVPDHILSSLIGPAVTLPVKKGVLVLGQWQRVVLVEFDGPKERQVIFSMSDDLG